MSLDRFYCPEAWSVEVDLLGPEAHHISRVLRKQPGELIEIFNGQGSYAIAEIKEVSKKSVKLTIMESHSDSQSTGPFITLAVASPKGDRLRLIIEKATELGVQRFIPISTERSVVQPRESKLEKLEQTVISACKQSGRNTLMEITAAMSLSLLTESLPEETLSLFGSPQGQALNHAIKETNTNSTLCIFIGPEGGFTAAEETHLLGSGALSVRLGQHILRVETAAISVAAAVLGLLSHE